MYSVQKHILQQDFDRARLLYQQGRLDAAADAIAQVLLRAPNAVPALHMRGRIALQLGQAQLAQRYLLRAVKLAPDLPALLNDAAVALASAGAVDRAADMFRRLIKLQPENPDGYRNLGLFLVSNARYEAALSPLQTYVRKVPEEGVGHSLLSMALYYSGDTSGALAEQKLAAAASPENPGPWELLGLIRLRQNRLAEAIQAFDAALERDPKRASAYGNKGQALAMLGRFAPARQALKTALDLAPQSLPFLSTLIELGPFQDHDDRLPYLTRLTPHLSELPEPDQIEMHMSLAKVADDLHQPAEAFAHWDAANVLARKLITYDEARDLQQMRDIARVFSAEMLMAHQGLGVASDRPVFIVGMPRSGSTLAEQILASHPVVYGAGECPEWNTWIGSGRLGADFPAHVSEVSPDTWKTLAETYLAMEKKAAPQARRVCDKMLSNFLWLGALHIALPGARFLHIHRRRADCALSCYARNFSGSLPYTYNLAELGRYMRGYETLMAHWRNVLPADCLLEIAYEDLVENFEPVVRHMLAFIGLNWDERCTQFYRTERTVATASIYSVRQPLNRRAIGRAEPYRPWLKAFWTAFGGDAGEKPSVGISPD